MDHQYITGQLKHLTNMDRYHESEMMLISENLIDTRLKLKKQMGEKINIVFLCYRPQIWSSLKTVYKALKEDECFNVQIVIIPVRKCAPDGSFTSEYESEGAEPFWEREYISGYNNETGEYLDLRELRPDYVFYQQSYNVMIPEIYRSWYVSKYAKICYVAYGYEMMRGSVIEGSHPTDFFQNVSYYFAQDKYNQYYTVDYLKRNKNTYTRSILTGYPKFDEIQTERSHNNDGSFKALWCPRWSEGEGNCNFYDYGKPLAKMFSEMENAALMFRPHPQMLVNIRSKDGRCNERLADIVNYIDSSLSCVMDSEQDYHISFASSDCMIADMTSMMGDYFLTGKPIIYCHKVDCFSDAGRALSEGFYWVNNISELADTLEMLISGEDPLFEKRQEIIKEHFYLPKGGAGRTIKEYIKKDALK